VLEDPSSASVARVYAQALLDSARPDGITAALEELGSLVTDVYAQVPGLRQLFSSASLSADEHVAVIDKVLAPRCTPLFANFLRVLARHRRLEMLEQIYLVATHAAEQRQGKRRIQVRSAIPLSADALQELTAKLQASTGAEPILEATVEPELLGGMIVRIGDTVYDGSLRTRLKQMSGRLRERCLHEIQRGRDRFSHPAGN